MRRVLGLWWCQPERQQQGGHGAGESRVQWWSCVATTYTRSRPGWRRWPVFVLSRLTPKSPINTTQQGSGGRGESCRHSTQPHTGEHSHRLLLSISMLRHAMSQCSNPASWIAIKPSAASHTIRTLVTQSNACEPLTLPASLCQQVCGGECEVPVSKPQQQQHRTWIELRPPGCLLAGTALQAWVLSAVVHH